MVQETNIKGISKLVADVETKPAQTPAKGVLGRALASGGSIQRGEERPWR